MNNFGNITLLDDLYDWNKMTLLEFLQEGNIPNGWEQFFERKDVHQELIKISKFISDSISKPEIIFPMIEHVFRAFIPLEIYIKKLFLKDFHLIKMENCFIGKNKGVFFLMLR